MATYPYPFGAPLTPEQQRAADQYASWVRDERAKDVARAAVITRALQVLTADRGDESSAHYCANQEYADDQLDEAVVVLAALLTEHPPATGPRPELLDLPEQGPEER